MNYAKQIDQSGTNCAPITAATRLDEFLNRSRAIRTDAVAALTVAQALLEKLEGPQTSQPERAKMVTTGAFLSELDAALDDTSALLAKLHVTLTRLSELI
jgi:hypothetical protein